MSEKKVPYLAVKGINNSTRRLSSSPLLSDLFSKLLLCVGTWLKFISGSFDPIKSQCLSLTEERTNSKFCEWGPAASDHPPPLFLSSRCMGGIPSGVRRTIHIISHTEHRHCFSDHTKRDLWHLWVGPARRVAWSRAEDRIGRRTTDTEGKFVGLFQLGLCHIRYEAAS